MMLRVLLLSAAALAAGNAAQAQVVYAERYAAQCAACHGAQGHSTTALVPHLGGQPAFYTVTQLFLFRDGRRDDHPQAATMTAMAKGMSDDDLRGFAQLIAMLPPPPAAAGPRDEAKAARGRALAQQHRCTACHGADLAGGGQVPRIGHQREDYLAIALKGFRSGARVGYTPAMSEVLAGLSGDDLDALAHYLARPAP